MERLIFDESINNICIYAKWLLILLNLYLFCKNKDSSGTGYFLLWLYVIVFCIFYIPKEGDVVGYFSLYKSHDKYGHLEPFYLWTINFIDQGFFVWRSFVWGSAMLFLILTFKLCKCSASVAAFSFLSFSLVQNFYYLRNSLAFAVLFFAASLIMYIENSALVSLRRYKYFAFILLFSTYFLHRSMPLYILLSLIALAFPLSKRNVYLACLFFPLGVYLFETISSLFLNSSIWMQDETVKNAMNSVVANGQAWNSRSFFGQLGLFITYLPSLYVFLYSPSLIEGDKTIEGRFMNYFLSVSFYVALISFVYLFKGASDIQIRFWQSSLLPFSFFVSIFLKKHLDTSIARHFLYLVFLSWSFYFVSFITTV